MNGCLLVNVFLPFGFPKFHPSFHINRHKHHVGQTSMLHRLYLCPTLGMTPREVTVEYCCFTTAEFPHCAM